MKYDHKAKQKVIFQKEKFFYARVWRILWGFIFVFAFVEFISQIRNLKGKDTHFLQYLVAKLDLMLLCLKVYRGFEKWTRFEKV